MKEKRLGEKILAWHKGHKHRKERREIHKWLKKLKKEDDKTGKTIYSYSRGSFSIHKAEIKLRKTNQISLIYYIKTNKLIEKIHSTFLR